MNTGKDKGAVVVPIRLKSELVEEIDELISRKRQAERGTFWEHPEELWE